MKTVLVVGGIIASALFGSFALLFAVTVMLMLLDPTLHFVAYIYIAVIINLCLGVITGIYHYQANDARPVKWGAITTLPLLVIAAAIEVTTSIVVLWLITGMTTATVIVIYDKLHPRPTRTKIRATMDDFRR